MSRALVLFLGASSCSSPSHGLVAFETLASLQIVPDRYDTPQAGGSSGFGGPVDELVPGVGFGVSLNTSAIDVVAVAQERFDDSGGRSELVLGIRKRLPDKNGAMGYVHAAHRMGDVDSLEGESISSGFVFGFGILVPVSRSGWFLDMSLGIESSYERLSGSHDEARLQGIVFGFGVGWALHERVVREW